MFKSCALSLCFLLAASGVAVAQERQWTLDASDQDAYLVFGVPESDDVGLSIWCTIQSGKTKIFIPEANAKLKPGGTADMRIRAGKLSLKLKGRVSDNREAGTTSLEAELDASAPLYAAMAGADRLKVTIAGVEQAYPLADADVTGLIKLCKKP